MLNGVKRLACQTLWWLFLLEDERVGESCMIYMQSGYNDLFHSCWSPFSQSGIDLEELIINAIIPALLPFCNKEPIYLWFQVSIWDAGIVRSKVSLLPSQLFHCH